MHSRKLVASFFAVAACFIAASTALSAPSITRLSVRGFQAGSTTTIVIDGADLLPEPRLISSAPISAQTLKPGATDAKIQIDVTIDAKTEPGFYNVWLVTAKGVSPIQVFAVDSLPQLPLAKEVTQLPVALHANFTGSKPVQTSFHGQAGQRVTIEVEAQRIGGKEQPVIHLLDADGHELGLALPSSQLHGDARLIATLPSDGIYSVQVHDLQYAGAGPLRLKIGSWQYADIAFPPAVERGKTTRLELIGPEGEKQEVDCTPGPLALMPAPWPDGEKASGMRPVISVSTIPELIEDKTGPSPMIITDVRPPFAISGRLSKPGEKGRYQLDIDPEATLRFAVMAAQIGSPIDAVLELRNAKGELLASNDDTAGSSDPQLDFKAPKGLTSIVVEVRDSNLRGSPASVYRLLVSPVSDKPASDKPAADKAPSATAKGDFDLIVDDNVIAPPANGKAVMKVIARRRDYDGPIALHLTDAPENFALQRAEIPAGADAALVTVVARPGAGDAPPAVAHLVGEGQDHAGGESTISRVALFEQHPLGTLQPWLRSDLLLAAAHGGGDAFAVGYGSGDDANQDVTGYLAQKVTLPVTCVRPVGFDGVVRLTLMTSQIAPLTRNATTPDPARTLRPEAAAVQIPADAKAQAAQDAEVAAEKALADAEKAAKAAKTSTPALEQKVAKAGEALAKAKAAAEKASTAAKNSMEVPLLVPADLPPGNYDLAFKAELLARDARTVVATSFTPVKRLNAVSPLLVKLDGASDAEVQLGTKKGAVATWSGTIDRLAGMKGEVTLVLEGLPKGVVDPKVVVAADKSEFKIELKIPPATEAGQTPGIKLFATIKPDPKAVIVVRSPNVELALNVLPMVKPAVKVPAKKPDKVAK